MLNLYTFVATNTDIDSMVNSWMLWVTIAVVVFIGVMMLIFGGRSITWRGIEDADYVYRKILSEINLIRRITQRIEDETEAE